MIKEKTVAPISPKNKNVLNTHGQPPIEFPTLSGMKNMQLKSSDIDKAN